MRTTIILSIIILMLQEPVLLQAKGGWQLKKESEGVKVYSRSVPGSKFKEWKGILDSNCPFEVALEIMKDYQNYAKWLGMCIQSILVKKIQMQISICTLPWTCH